ncbi:hypothetical protein GCM10010401_02970 [Rarobacter faecitabidus]|uniref:Transcriptional regulator WhiB n=1 Tax=Rarobacter faecitabidus TaxID=13243 RepID=A0A542ZUK9_RARFA|nr:WhiB family transcriptional regulator [Rarobacter faecitabidus]TQL63946.1 WhiB family redox-sensing transcriptional regulator [Rarobacter faecitabidus]
MNPAVVSTLREPITGEFAASTAWDASAFVAATISTPCRSNDADLWFAERTSDIELAKSLCRECPLVRQCLEGALAREEPWGVWGGQSFVDGRVVAQKRGRGRPRKNPLPALAS